MHQFYLSPPPLFFFTKMHRFYLFSGLCGRERGPAHLVGGDESLRGALPPTLAQGIYIYACACIYISIYLYVPISLSLFLM
jgi:hypothetical protein